jgi:dipeptidyl aminopeptidase/acylaminoacyl peptidase
MHPRLRFLPLLSLAATVALANPPPELPLETFFADPQASQVQISPDGRYLALLAPANDRMQVVVVDRKAGKRQRITDMKDESVVSLGWTNNSRLIFRQQVKGQESFGTYAVNADGTNLRVLQQATVREGDRVANMDDRRGFTLVDDLPADPDNILVDVARGNSGLGDLYLLNVNNERRRIVMQNIGKARHWIADRNGVVRIAFEQDENDTHASIKYRKDEKSEWRELVRVPRDGRGWQPVAFDGDNRTLIIVSDVDRTTRGLFTFDPEKMAITGTLVDDPVYDVAGQRESLLVSVYSPALVYSQKKKRVVGVRYDAEKPKTVWFDPDFKALQASLDAALPDTLNTITSFTADESVFIVTAASDRDPGSFYLYDAKANSLSLLARRFPEIDPAQMAEMRPFQFKARDGMQLYGYITLPAGREAKKLPMIVNPHGGPYGPRDSWRFTPEIQFLANRGYAVLQVNFRGSGGYGRDYEAAGYRQWGLKMQDDLTDGVKWAIEQGYADPSRVAIYGASYGGYATLAGLVYTPELYVCGVNYVGAVDTERLGLMRAFNSMPKPMQDYVARRWLHPLKDAEQIRATSPVNFVENIRVPLLMAYGEYDPRVTIDHGQVLERELKKHGKQYKNIVIGNEGHGFGKLENRIAFYREMDKFFAEHLRPVRGSVELGPIQVKEMPARLD